MWGRIDSNMTTRLIGLPAVSMILNENEINLAVVHVKGSILCANIKYSMAILF